jgi:hypothetical protein
LPPVIAVLLNEPKTRGQIVEEFRTRFDIQERLADTMINEQILYLVPGQRGHERIWELNRANVGDAPWARFLPATRE